MRKHPNLFAGGRNIAIKIPPHEFDATTRFYRDVLELAQISSYLPSVVFEFGPNLLWLDRVDTIKQAEVWLELRTPNTAEAAEHLAGCNVVRCDTVEKLPEGFDGFWIASPANVVHLVYGRKEDV